MNDTGFWWILLACAVYGVLHSLLAAEGTKRAAARAWGERAYHRYYRLLFSVVGTVTALPLLALVALLPDRILYTIPTPWRWLTLALQGAALIGLSAGVLQTGALSFVGVRQLLQPDAPAEGFGTEKLVVTGLYRWVRHPLYTFSLLLLWLAPVMTWNLLALTIGLTVYMLAGAYFLEEPKLVRQFGPDYETYRRKTPMILPGIKTGPS